MLLISFKRTTCPNSKQPNLTKPFPLGSPYVDGFAFENSLCSFLHFGGWTDLPGPRLPVQPRPGPPSQGSKSGL
jgi:hypothetical protein